MPPTRRPLLPQNPSQAIAAGGPDGLDPRADLILLFGDGVAVPALLKLLTDVPVAARFGFGARPLPGGPPPLSASLDVLDPDAIAEALEPFRGRRALVLGLPQLVEAQVSRAAAQTALTSDDDWLAILKAELSRLDIGVASLAAEQSLGRIRRGVVYGPEPQSAHLAAARVVREISRHLRSDATLGVFRPEAPEEVAWSVCDPVAGLRALRGRPRGGFGYLRSSPAYFGPSASPLLAFMHLRAAAAAGLAGLFVESGDASLDLLGSRDRSGLSDVGLPLLGGLFVFGL